MLLQGLVIECHVLTHLTGSPSSRFTFVRFLGDATGGFRESRQWERTVLFRTSLLRNEAMATHIIVAVSDNLECRLTCTSWFCLPPV